MEQIKIRYTSQGTNMFRTFITLENWHILKKGATIFSKLIPFSKKLKFLLKNEKLLINKVLSWGDDYQVIFTSNSKNRLKISKLSRDSKYKITLIGKINNTKELDFQGFNLKKAKKNYLHAI